MEASFVIEENWKVIHEKSGRKSSEWTTESLDRTGGAGVDNLVENVLETTRKKIWIRVARQCIFNSQD